MQTKTLLIHAATSVRALRHWSPRRQYDQFKAFVAYATAFEAAYAANDWTRVADHLDTNVVWTIDNAPPPIGGAWTGRGDALAAVARSCNLFDRRFDRRLPRIVDGPVAIPGGIYINWAVNYGRDGLPDLVLRGEEWDFFRDGRMVHHREIFTNLDEVQAYFERHEGALLPAQG